MAYKITEPDAAFTPIALVDVGFAPPVNVSSGSTSVVPTPPNNLGQIVRAIDPVYGAGEFICLQGVASTVVGSIVSWAGVNSTATQTWQTALAAATANQGQPLAVAMAATLAGQYGWYQIQGNAVVATNGTLAAGPGKVFLAGSGQVTSSAAAGAEVLNAINVSATGTPAAGLAIVSIDRPFAQGQIT